MNESLQTALTRLRLSGLAASLDVRVTEAAGHHLYRDTADHRAHAGARRGHSRSAQHDLPAPAPQRQPTPSDPAAATDEP